MKDRVYAIVHRTRKEAYIGRTYRSLEARWAEHRKAAADGASSKTLYERMRHEPDQWVIVECEYSETASEAAWLEAFRDDGYAILNDTGCNARKPKQRRGDAERDWIALNDAAERRVLQSMDPEVLAAERAELSALAKEWDAVLRTQVEGWVKTRNQT